MNWEGRDKENHCYAPYPSVGDFKEIFLGEDVLPLHQQTRLSSTSLSSANADGFHVPCSEETECRFCTNTLPDWRKALEDKPKAAPLMTVSHNGEVHVLQVN